MEKPRSFFITAYHNLRRAQYIAVGTSRRGAGKGFQWHFSSLSSSVLIESPRQSIHISSRIIYAGVPISVGKWPTGLGPGVEDYCLTKSKHIQLFLCSRLFNPLILVIRKHDVLKIKIKTSDLLKIGANTTPIANSANFCLCTTGPEKS